MIKRLICKLFGHKWGHLPLGYMLAVIPDLPDPICLRCGYSVKTRWNWYGGYGVSSKDWIIRGE